MCCQSCAPESHGGRTDFQYAVKLVCGVLQPVDRGGRPLPSGQYFTAVNIHNPSRCDSVTLRWKVAVGLPTPRIGTVSPFAEVQLGPDEAVEIDCPNVMEQLARAGGRAPEFVKGWVVIESPCELDVVAVYGGAEAPGRPLNTFSTERVCARRMEVCGDFSLDISTGVAAWEYALPNSAFFMAPTLSQGSSAWSDVPGSLWLLPGGAQDAGVYTYRLAFRLCSGFRGASLNLQLLADNCAIVSLNGNQIGSTAGQCGSTDPFRQVAILSTGNAAFFKAGLNVLTVAVTNQGNITGMALQGRIRVEGGLCPGSTMPLLSCPRICYQLHLKGDGWTSWGCNGSQAGTTGENRRAEALIVQLSNAAPGTTVEYKVHEAFNGWTGWSGEGQQAGTTGQNRRIEAVQIRLVNAPLNCRIRYRVHMKNLGWSSWMYDGGVAGTTGQNRRMEAIEVVIE
jgi:hypothetical protein